MPRRRGFTLIELFVVVTLIGILVALILPAVQSAREAARRSQCSSNLKQMALGSANFEATRGQFAPGYGPLPDPAFRASDAIGQGGRANVQIQILPYLEQSNLYNLFNFSFDLNYIVNDGSSNPNFTAGTQLVQSFLCPTDSSTARMKGGVGLSNYFASMGDTASQLYGPSRNSDGSETYCETSAARLGLFNVSLDPLKLTVIDRVTTASVTDGTSNTAMFSETTRSQQDSSTSGSPEDSSYVFLLFVGDFAWNNNLWPQACASWNPSRPMRQISYRGLQYYRNFPATGYYAHTIVPNFRGHDCASTGGWFGSGATIGGGPINFFAGHIAARSYHAAGVNVAMGDGSVRFVGNSISQAVWGALGTRAGGEVVAAD